MIGTINLWDPGHVTLTVDLVTAFLLGLVHGITPDEYPCDIIGPFYYEADILKEPLPLHGGRAAASERPGLGVELHEGIVESYRVQV